MRSTKKGDIKDVNKGVNEKVKETNDKCKHKDLLICNSDNSSKFFMTREKKYAKEAKLHIKDNEVISYKKVKEIEECLNTECRKWTSILTIGVVRIRGK